MKIKALFVAPYRGLMELAAGMAAEQAELELSIVHADLSEILPHLKRYEEDGCEIIISRGGTAKLISEYCSLPVIEIPVTGFDILRMLTLIKEYTVRLEMIGFPNIVEGVVSISNVMNFELPYTIIHQENEVEAAVEQAKARDTAVIVGDSIAVKMAEKFGMQGILITSGREAVQEAFNQAKQVYSTLHKYKMMNGICEELMNQMDAGAARLSEDGVIRYANASFYQWLGVSQKDEAGSLFGKYPYFRTLLRCAMNGWANRDMMVYDGDRKFVWRAGVVRNGEPNPNEINLLIGPTAEAGQEAVLHYVAARSESPLAWVVGLTDFMRQLQQSAGQLSFPLVIQGKKGTAKAYYAQGIHQIRGNGDQPFFELRLGKSTKQDLISVARRLGEWDAAFCITGFELMSLPMQRAWLEAFQSGNDNLIFCMDEPLRRLYEKNALDAKVYDWLKKKSRVEIPALKEMADFDVIVRSLIIKYNEMYGKQIVGIRPAVLEYLRRQPWEGDIVELKEAIRELVMRSEDEFLDQDVLKTVLSQTNRRLAGSGPAPLDLTQPLKK